MVTFVTLSRLAAVLPIMVGLLALSSVAKAETQDFRQSTVHYTQRDFATPKARRALDRRISAAVRMVCPTGTGTRIPDQNCTSTAAAQARHDLAALNPEFAAAQVASR